MKCEHKELIHDYLNLDNRIRRTKKRLENIRNEFRGQNFYGKTDFDNVIGIRSKGFRVEPNVCYYLDLIDTTKNNIAKYRRRKHHFSRYVSTIDKHIYISLKRRYRHIDTLENIQVLGHDKKVLDEILEIEEAISFEFNEPLLDEVNKELIAIEYEPLTNDTLEQSFDRITELLGV